LNLGEGYRQINKNKLDLPSRDKPKLRGRRLKLETYFCWGSKDWEARLRRDCPKGDLLFEPSTASFKVISLRIISAMIGNLFLMARFIANS